MLQLTNEQKEFIEKYKIPVNVIFDATGFSTKDYKIYMKKNKIDFAIGVIPCKKNGHTMREKHGHCAMCEISKIHLGRCISRYENIENYTYITISQIEKVVKVGFSKNIQNRKKTLNETCYGSISDWQIVYFAKFSRKAFEIERKTQNLLSKYFCEAEYFKNGRNRSAYELVKCSYKTTKDALNEVKRQYPTDIFLGENEMLNTEQLFNFENVENNTKRRKI